MNLGTGAITEEFSGVHRQRDVGVWLAWGFLVALAVACLVWALHVLLDWPRNVTPWWFMGCVALPIALLASVVPPVRAHGAAVLRHTAVLTAEVAMILGVYLVVVVGLGRDLDGTEHRVLGLSMVAAFISVVLAGPLRRRVNSSTESWLGTATEQSTAALETFGARMTRSVPMDELLLQLAETLQKTIGPAGAELWVGESGSLDRTVSVPNRGEGTIHLTGPALGAVTSARVSGSAWGSMWIPDLLHGFDDGDDIRIASITHLGKLLGLVLVVRHGSDGPFRPADEVALADLARSLGLALHNVSLDSALQRSLNELEQRNVELQASRTRIVSAADESRRLIERNLHDGAQQHLVALALKSRLLEKRFGTSDPDLLTALDQFHDDIQTTIDEVRELAHGIYPPLLRDRGLATALTSAAARSPLPTTVEATDTRFGPDIEAAVYFCCLEAMQNAAKYAGEGAKVVVSVSTTDTELMFEVADDGAGFDPSTVAESHGFVNMRDRIGAHGGDLGVESKLGTGTRIAGRLPLPPKFG